MFRTASAEGRLLRLLREALAPEIRLDGYVLQPYEVTGWTVPPRATREAEERANGIISSGSHRILEGPRAGVRLEFLGKGWNPQAGRQTQQIWLSLVIAETAEQLGHLQMKQDVSPGLA